MDLLDLLAGFAAQLDGKVWRLSMEMANTECHSLAALDYLLLILKPSRSICRSVITDLFHFLHQGSVDESLYTGGTQRECQFVLSSIQTLEIVIDFFAGANLPIKLVSVGATSKKSIARIQGLRIAMLFQKVLEVRVVALL